jgi:hypothetical protein
MELDDEDCSWPLEVPSEPASAFDFGEFEAPDKGTKEEMRVREREYRQLIQTIAYMTKDATKLEQYCQTLLNRIDRLKRERPIEKMAEAWSMLSLEDRHASVSVMLDALEQKGKTDTLDELGQALLDLRLAQNRESRSSIDGLEGFDAEIFKAQQRVKDGLVAVLQKRDFALRVLNISEQSEDD